MNYGITSTTLTAVRKEPDHRTEMVHQLLFGETFIIRQSIGSWKEIELTPGTFTGWVETGSVETFGESGFKEINKIQLAEHLLKVLKNNSEKENLFLLPGSEMPDFDRDFNTFHIGSNVYTLDSPIVECKIKDIRKRITEVSKYFLNTPFLWGGRSLFGMDAPGFVQLVYKLIGMALPRNLDQMVEQGALVPFQKKAQPGDLAFFEDTHGNIIHTGLILNHDSVIHASAVVRIDAIDHQGIKSPTSSAYSHRLRIIKTLL